MGRDGFRSYVELEKHNVLELDDPILTLGSCFSEAIGAKLKGAKWDCLNNPFGTQFHPLALFKLLELSLKGEDLPPDLYLEDDGAFFHSYLPRSFFAPDKESLAATFRHLSAEVKACLHRPKAWLFLTLGTAFIYEKEGRQWVSNCHQQDGRLFQKRLLQASEIREAWYQLAPLLPSGLRSILTLSPVRHQRDGFPKNSVSKALLRLFIEDICEGQLRYFPAYEILLDELRDYRFYACDRLHPSEEAIAYIWQQFCSAFLSPHAQSVLKDWERLKSRLEHRFQRPDAPAARAFREQLLRDLEAFGARNVTEEIARLRECLRN